MDQYEKGNVIGHGTYGSVCRAVHRPTGQVVAIKKIRVGDAKEGVHLSALREIKVLQELKYPYIIRLLNVFPHKQKLALVFEHMEADLETVIKDTGVPLLPADVKAYMKMILLAVNHIHSQKIVHRDIKPNNLLVSATGDLKLADFGLARIISSPDGRYTNQVFAKWYRPPELLYGATDYDMSVDMWAVGCVFAELMLRKVWFQGETDVDQLERIFQALGTPKEEEWQTMKKLPHFLPYKKIEAPTLSSLFPDVPPEALDLLSGLVRFNPSARLTAQQALEHPYFSVMPEPTLPAKLAKPRLKDRTPLQAMSVPSLMNLKHCRSSSNLLAQMAEEHLQQAAAGGVLVDKPTAYWPPDGSRDVESVDASPAVHDVLAGAVGLRNRGQDAAAAGDERFGFRRGRPLRRNGSQNTLMMAACPGPTQLQQQQPGWRGSSQLSHQHQQLPTYPLRGPRPSDASSMPPPSFAYTDSAAPTPVDLGSTLAVPPPLSGLHALGLATGGTSYTAAAQAQLDTHSLQHGPTPDCMSTGLSGPLKRGRRLFESGTKTQGHDSTPGMVLGCADSEVGTGRAPSSDGLSGSGEAPTCCRRRVDGTDALECNEAPMSVDTNGGVGPGTSGLPPRWHRSLLAAHPGGWASVGPSGALHAPLFAPSADEPGSGPLLGALTSLSEPLTSSSPAGLFSEVKASEAVAAAARMAGRRLSRFAQASSGSANGITAGEVHVEADEEVQPEDGGLAAGLGDLGRQGSAGLDGREEEAQEEKGGGKVGGDAGAAEELEQETQNLAGNHVLAAGGALPVYTRKQLTSDDLRYLRRRKLYMDQAFDQASQDGLDTGPGDSFGSQF